MLEAPAYNPGAALCAKPTCRNGELLETSTMATVPKTIREHAAVQESGLGEDEDVDYKYVVWLKEGFSFKSGRMAGCRSGHFNTAAEFRNAAPSAD